MRAAVVGAAGAAGRAVAAALEGAGHAVVRVEGGADGWALARALAGAEVVVDAAVAAGRGRGAACAAGRAADLALRMARRAGARKAVLLSSAAVYGWPERREVGEAHPRAPVGAWARALSDAEEHAERHARDGLDVDVLRPAPLATPGGRLALLFRALRRGLPVPVPRGAAWQLLDPADLAAAALAAALRPHPGELRAWNLAAGPPTALLDDLRALRRHARSRSPLVPVPTAAAGPLAWAAGLLAGAPLRPEHDLPVALDTDLQTTAAARDLAFAPRRSTADALCAAWDAWAGA